MQRRKFQGNFATRETRRSQSRTVERRLTFVDQANSSAHVRRQRSQAQRGARTSVGISRHQSITRTSHFLLTERYPAA